MAEATPCQTPGAFFHTVIHGVENTVVTVAVELPHNLNLTEDEAKLLETNIHNALELVLARYFPPSTE